MKQELVDEIKHAFRFCIDEFIVEPDCGDGWHPVILTMLSSIEAVLDGYILPVRPNMRIGKRYGYAHIWLDLRADEYDGKPGMPIVGMASWAESMPQAYDSPPDVLVDAFDKLEKEFSKLLANTCENCGVSDGTVAIRKPYIDAPPATGRELVLCSQHFTYNGTLLSRLG
jgi:hypothetical protein